MIIILVLLVILAIFNILLGVLSLIRSRKKLSNISFMGLTLSIGLWCLGIVGFYTASDATVALYWTQLYYIAPTLLVYTLVIFALSFPDQRIKPVHSFVLSTPLLAFLFAITLNSNFIVNSIQLGVGNTVVRLDPYHYFAYGVYIVLYFVLGLGVLLLKSGRKSEVAKQAKVFLVGATASAFLGLIFNLILPALQNYNLIWVGPLGTTIFVGFLYINMTRYRMFDVRLYAVRLIGFSALTLLLSVCYVAPLIYLFCILTGIEILPWRLALASILFSIGAIYYGRLQKRFRNLTQKVFFQGSYDSAYIISELNKKLVSAVRISEIVNTVGNILDRSLQPEYYYFMIYDEQSQVPRIIGSAPDANYDIKPLLNVIYKSSRVVTVTEWLDSSDPAYQLATDSDVGAIVKIKQKEAQKFYTVGYMIVGPKKSGSSYNTQDVQTLEAISGVLQISVRNALQYEQIKGFNTTLQERVDEATRKLRMSNTKLKALDETKDDFMSMASHQLRTPLTSIKGYISMLMDGDMGELKPMQRKALEEAYNSSQRMVYLIGDFLNLSRLKTGKFEIEISDVSLPRLIQEEIAQLRATADARGVSLVYDAPVTFPEIKVDETKIRQVMMNFIDNAVYYSKPSGGRVSIVLEHDEKSVSFRVIDNGIGVEKDEQKHLFTKFYRTPRARKARPDGTGIGIYMAKKVIDAHHGEVVFESQQDIGSTFGFRLPIDK